ncbi:MAG: ankyrin repeat domain-containing protein, partial [bacterium]|nr:ankyrin repeat domain-containing protein [bacterium]
HGADFSAAQQPWNSTPLFFLLGHRESDPQWTVAKTGIRWLLEVGGADPNVPSGEMELVPLHLAARRHSAHPIEMLLAHEAHVDCPTPDGQTPYSIAARHGNVAAMEIFRAHGGATKLSATDELLAACASGDSTTAQLILDRMPGLIERLGPQDFFVLPELAALNKIEAIKTFCAVGFPLDNLGDQKSTALHQACWHGHAEIAATLVENGAAMNIPDGDYQGTALDWVCHGSLFRKQSTPDVYAEIAALLLRHESPLPDEHWGSEEVQVVLRQARGS